MIVEMAAQRLTSFLTFFNLKGGRQKLGFFLHFKIEFYVVF